MQSHRLVVIVP